VLLPDMVPPATNQPRQGLARHRGWRSVVPFCALTNTDAAEVSAAVKRV
jgi:hypothetical protein